ncbi:MAG: beta-galactosidase [Anaerocolumna sp.]
MKKDEFGFNAKYMLKNGKPWFPVMGEIHYSRYPKQYWRESVYKMKAGGVETISTYVFWLHHEEVEKEYDFTGDRDLRAFVNTVKECNMTMFLRIGPWCHGEARNGGMPDWILKKDYNIRTNDEKYLAEVECYYKKIEEQVSGLLYKDGGPIIGIQIENEYGHCGGLQGEEGEEHMRRLTEIAKKVGLVTPLYTATGWGGAVTGGLLPVMGGYCEAPWDQRLTEIEPSGNYVFTKERNDHNIGSDYGFGTGITYDLDKFPFLTAELGGGLQVTHHRRPVAGAKDIGAMSMVKLGSGVNLLGYYMYHGGTNPKGKLTTLQESRETGYPNDLPVFSYDFNAPIREFGQMSQTLRELKLITMFVQDFGSQLCEMDTYLPESNPLFQTNFTDLRTSVRRKENSGYLFVNNFQRRYTMADHGAEVLKVELEKEIIEYPSRDIKNGDYFFYPFHMKVGDGLLKSALATPLCILHNGKEETYVFYTDVDPVYEWINEPTNAKVITISRDEALKAWKIGKEKEYLLISNADVIESESGYELIGRDADVVKAYPALLEAPKGYTLKGMEQDFSVYECVQAGKKSMVEWTFVKEEGDSKFYDITMTYPEKLNDCFLRVDFGGDQAKLYIENEWVGDWFYTGQTLEIGLKRFDFPKKMQVEIISLKDTDKCFLETWPEFTNGVACDIAKVDAEVETVYPIQL